MKLFSIITNLSVISTSVRPVFRFFSLVAFVWFITGFSLSSFSQPVIPDNGEIFREDVVPRIDIFIHPDTLQWIYNNVESNIEWRADFVFDNGFVTDTIEEIGFRLRGNTSRQSAKKSFKVSFNTYQKGRKYHGLEKMNLNGEHNDPSVTRAKLFWDLCRSLEIAAPRSNHVRVFINNNYYGLYLNVEHIDEEFAESRFGTQYGNLYKCLYPADLKYVGNNPDAYKMQAGERRVYDLKTNKAYDDYSDIVHFISVLNNTPVSTLACELEKVFNVQDYLKILALDVITANWDGYVYNKNNFYLYKNPLSDRFEYIPYDVDNTFGIDWFNIDWTTRDIYQWSPSNQQSEKRPLYNRLMQVQRYRDLYTFYLSQISWECMDQPDYFNYLDGIRDRIYPFISDDPYYPLDYGFSPDDFLDAFESEWGAHVKYGIKPYILARLGSLENQMILNPVSPIANYLSLQHTGIGNPLNFSVKVQDDEPGLAVWLRYRFNNEGFLTLLMEPEQEGFFDAVLNGVTEETTLKYHIQILDGSGNTLFYPCGSIEYYFPPPYSSGLYINEIMASNSTIHFDADGEYDDWIELFNGGAQPVWLGDMFFSDNPEIPDKWSLPDYTLFPGEFVLVWADEDPEQGPFHADFKLSADGEFVGIYSDEASGFMGLDVYSFSSQQTDISLGRSPDGSNNWVYFTNPTPGISNSFSTVDETPGKNQQLNVFPNPVTDDFIYLSEVSDYKICSLGGELVAPVGTGIRIDVSGLKKGVYLLKTINYGTVKFVKL
ncbi:MAG TPA: CotH kinase family protein [Bacteroidales bacterium]|nr:CotH kinase family protein [Bacteroidales bacterium]HRW96974.1 CotH kinase family protein [Bacteroidales bacterium]